MKGIILAGGSGTRLRPITNTINKQLLPIFDKPMIYYPLSTLMLLNIKDILIITNPKDLESFKLLLGDGKRIGIRITYAVQESPNGIADAFNIGREYIGDDNVTLILGDNIFYGHGFLDPIRKIINKPITGATIFGYSVNDPERYGVVEFDSNYNVISIEEKPENPKSNYAVPGMYIYNNDVVKYTKTLIPSKRGELEITDLNKIYLNKNKLKVNLLGRGVAWLDTGKPNSLFEASTFISYIEARQGLKISCIEEIAYNMGYISEEKLEEIVCKLPEGCYKDYLTSFIKLINI